MKRSELLGLLASPKTPYFTYAKQTYILVSVDCKHAADNTFSVTALDNRNNRVNLYIITKD